MRVEEIGGVVAQGTGLTKSAIETSRDIGFKPFSADTSQKEIAVEALTQPTVSVDDISVNSQTTSSTFSIHDTSAVAMELQRQPRSKINISA